MPPRLGIEAVDVRYAGPSPVRALANVSLEVPPGECLAILGPSGCGKTTLLRVVAGLQRPDGGRVTFDGRDVTPEAPERRNVGFVFQSDALFPQATAYENVAFGPRARGLPDVPGLVARAAERARATAFLHRRPGELSGGERQRVALARAIASSPDVLILDEPLSRLDASLRADLRRELAALVRDRRATALYVTHDQTEATAIGDRVAILESGVLEAVGDARRFFEDPPTAAVAAAIGLPAIAFLDVATARAAGAPAIANAARFGVRATAVRLSDDGPLRGIVTGLETFGDVAFANVEGAFGLLIARVEGERPAPGSHACLSIAWPQAFAFDGSGKRVGGVPVVV